MIDVNPFPIKVSLFDMPEIGGAGWFGSKKSEEDEEKELWKKEATIFKSYGRMGVKKTIAFTRDVDIHCFVGYAESDLLPVGTEEEIVRYNITGVAKFAAEMAQKGLNKPKITLQFELSSSGITSLIKAEATVEEIVIVEEIVEVEVDDDEEEGEETKDSDEKDESEEEVILEEKDKSSESIEDSETTENGDEKKTDEVEATQKKKESKKKNSNGRKGKEKGT